MKIKSKNLLTVILALLCSVTLALGIAFALPKSEKINANAAVYPDVNVSFGTAKYSATNDNEGVTQVSYSTMGDLPAYSTYTPSSGTGSGTLTMSVVKGGNWKHRNVFAVPVILQVEIPAHTVYQVDYTTTFSNIGAVTNYSAIRAEWTDGDGSDDDMDIDGFVYNGAAPSTNIVVGSSENKSNGTDKKYLNYGILLSNDGNSTKQITVHTYYIYSIHHNGSPGASYNFTFTINCSVTNDTTYSGGVISVPKTTETSKSYDGTEKSFDIIYAPVVCWKDETNTYVDYNDVDLTVDAKDYADQIIPSSEYNKTEVPNGVFKATESGKYTLEFKLKDSAVSNGVTWGDGSVTSKKVTFEITLTPISVPKPTVATKEYNASGCTFDLNSDFNPAIMTPSGVTSGITWNPVTSQFEAKDVGTYTVKFHLDDNHYLWNVNGTETTTDQTVVIEITRKTLVMSSNPTATSNPQWGLGDTGVLSVTASTGSTTENVILDMYYCKDGDTTLLYDGVDNSTGKLDISQVASAGSYTLYVKLANPNINAVNKNYKITDDVWSVPFKINAGSVSVNLDWMIFVDGVLINPLFKTDGSQEEAVYSYDSLTQKAVVYSVKADLPAGSYLTFDTFCTESGYTLGVKTVKITGGTESAPLSEVKDAGTYRTYIALISDDDHLFDAAHAHNTSDLTKGWISVDWTVSPKEIDFSSADWVFSYDGDENDPAARWTKYDPANGNKPVFNKNLDIYVKIDDCFITNLGLTTSDVVINYAGSNFESLPNYNGGTGTPKTTLAQITLKNSVTNYTLQSNTVSFDWYIFNEAIEAAGWTTKPIQGSSSDGTQKAFEFPVLDVLSGFESYIEYTYTFTINGQTYTDVSEADMIATIFDYADETHKVTVTVTPHIKTQYITQYDLDLSNTSSTETVVIGDSKIMVQLEFTGSHSVYGDGGDFSIAATYYNGNDKNTAPLDFWALGGADTEVILTLPDGSTQKFTANDLGNVINYLENKGDYKFEFNITNAQLSKKYSFSPTATLILTVKPKAISLPTLNEVVFKNDMVDLRDYLGGSWNEYKDIITVGGTCDGVKNVGTYSVTLTLTDGNYCWEYGTGATPAKAAVKNRLTDNEVSWSGDETIAKCDWQITPYVLKTSGWNLKGKEGALYNIPAELTDGLDVGINYLYHPDKASSPLGDGEELKAGTTYFVKAQLIGEDSRNFVFEDSKGTTSDFATYKLPQSGAAAIMNSVKNFMTQTWLGLPVWAWFLIGLALLILLIIIIVVAVKRRKSKEEREAKKAAKEEERQRREEERRLQQERLEAERELARAKQEAELEKIRAQAQMSAGAAGMATMAMQQPQQPAQQQQMPAQQQMPVDNGALARIEAEIAKINEKIASQQTAQPQYINLPVQQPQQQYIPVPVQQQMQPQFMSVPMQQQMPMQMGGNGGEYSDLRADVRSMREEQRSDREVAALKKEMELEFAKMRADGLYGVKSPAQIALPAGFENAEQSVHGGQTVQGNSAEVMGAIMAAFVKNIAANNYALPAAEPVQEPQEERKPEVANTSANYPSNAVITTTTTVDTTKGSATTRSGQVEDGRLFDIDGFYDAFDGNK